MKINGLEGPKNQGWIGCTLALYLDAMQLNPQCLVVEINQKIIPRDAYSSTLLGDEDCIEIVNFVGGG